MTMPGEVYVLLMLLSVGPAGVALQGAPPSCLDSHGTVCSNHGLCLGEGWCQCDEYHLGPLCENSLYSLDRCRSLRPCVQCYVYGTGPYARDECHSRCGSHTNIRIAVVEELDGSSASRMCRFLDEDNCVTNFAFTVNDGLNVKVKRVKECL